VGKADQGNQRRAAKAAQTRTRKQIAEMESAVTSTRITLPKPTPTGDVMVAWVHSEWVAHSWFQSILALVMTSPRVGPYTAMKCGTDGLVAARNSTVQAFLSSPAQYLFWVDTDMGFAPDTLDRLLAVADKDTAPVVGALCFANRETHTDGYGGYRCRAVPTAFRWLELPDGKNGFQPIWDYPRDEVIPVAGTGSACIVIHRSVFEKIQANEDGRPGWYNRLTNPTTGQVIGEDLSFCYRAVQAGAALFVDTGTKTTHLKPIWLQEDDYEAPVFDSVMDAG
jgi:hypothetical protein